MPDPLEPRQRLFRGVWSVIPSERDPSWVDRAADWAPTGRHLSDVGPTIRRMLDAGVAREDIAHLARHIGCEVSAFTLYLLGDSYGAYDDDDVPYEEHVHWNLFRVDPEALSPLEPLTVLHEGFLAADPEAPPEGPDAPGAPTSS